MIRSTLARGAAVSMVAMLALTACGGADDEAPQDDAPAAEAPAEDDGAAEEAEGDIDDAEEGADSADTEDAEDADADSDDSDADAEDADDAADAPAGEGVEVPIDETFTDPETGDEITIISAMRDMPTEYDSVYVEEGGEVVYLQVEVTPGEDFGGTISSRDFGVTYGDGKSASAKGGLGDEIEDAGMETFERLPRRDGETVQGWMGYTIEGDRQDTYTGEYLRPEAEVLMSDDVLPEFRVEFEIPSA